MPDGAAVDPRIGAAMVGAVLRVDLNDLGATPGERADRRHAMSQPRQLGMGCLRESRFEAELEGGMDHGGIGAGKAQHEWNQVQAT